MREQLKFSEAELPESLAAVVNNLPKSSEGTQKSAH